MLEAVLFDFDGTIADTSPGIFHTAIHAMRSLGFNDEYKDEDLRRFVGPPLRDCFRIAFGLDPKYIDEAVAIYHREYSEHGMYMCSLYPGILDLLGMLRNNGIRIGLATFKGEKLAYRCLENLGILGCFDAVFGSDDSESRTKSDIIRLCLSELGVKASDALMVGDTENDRKGASGASVPFAAVTWGFGYHKGDAIMDYTVDSADELGKLALKLRGE